MEYRIKELCKERGINLADLASQMGTSQASISRITTGNGNPTVETLERIAKALNVPITDLFAIKNKELSGHVEYKGVVYTIKSRRDLENLLKII